MKPRLFKIAARSAKVVLFLTALISVERFCHKQTRGFRLYKIASNFPHNKNWETASLSDSQTSELDALFKQPFIYLGDGGQSYAFLSEDKTVVLKFFKLHHMYVPDPLTKMWLPTFLHERRQKLVQKCNRKLNRTFGSCKIAYDSFREETGLLYVHLNRTDHWKKKVTIQDRLGIFHQVDLDSTNFVLQKRADLFLEQLQKHISSHEQELSEKNIRSFLELLALRCQRGIKDKDTGLKRNFGLINGKVVEIDIGSFLKDDSLKQKERMQKEVTIKTKLLYLNLQKQAPELVPFYERALEEICDEFSQKI